MASNKDLSILKAMVRQSRTTKDEQDIRNAIRYSIEKGISNKKLRALLSGDMI